MKIKEPLISKVYCNSVIKSIVKPNEEGFKKSGASSLKLDY